MSSILKALARLEQEKAATRRDPVRINAELLCAPPAKRVSPVIVIMVAALLFVCGGTATYVFMHQRTSPFRPAQVPGHRQVIFPPPVAPVRSVPTARRGDNQESAVPVPPQERAQRHRRPDDRQVAPGRDEPPVPVPRSPAAKIVVQDVQHALPPALPLLKVDGIAFQDGGDGVAVVNGVAVSRGGFIEGARVEEIQRDRVLFRYGGRKFEAMMGTPDR